jgi:hypothetical protein
VRPVACHQGRLLAQIAHQLRRKCHACVRRHRRALHNTRRADRLLHVSTVISLLLVIQGLCDLCIIKNIKKPSKYLYITLSIVSLSTMLSVSPCQKTHYVLNFCNRVLSSFIIICGMSSSAEALAGVSCRFCGLPGK